MCGGCLCSGGSRWTSGVNCVLEDVSKTMFFSIAECVRRLSVQWGSSGTGGVDYVLKDGSNTMLFFLS